jgi:hypothetical protein
MLAVVCVWSGGSPAGDSRCREDPT